MVMIGQGLGQTLANRKSTSDFMREAEAFEAAKQERAMQRQLQEAQLKQAAKDLNAVDYETRAMDAIFKANLGQELTPEDKASIGVMAAKDPGKTTYEPDVTGNVVARTIPSPWEQYMNGGRMTTGAMTQGINPNAPHPLDPMAAHDAAVMQRGEEIGFNPYQKIGGGQYDDMGVTPMNLADIESTLKMPAGQGAKMDIPMTLPPAIANNQNAKQKYLEKQAENFAEAGDPKLIADQESEAKKTAQRQKAKMLSGDVVLKNADSALATLEGGGFWTAGTPANITRWFGETNAGKLDKTYLANMKANIGFDKMMQQKEMSPTGASGLGQLTEQERAALEKTLSSLDVTQDPALLAEGIKTVHNKYMDMIHGTPDEIRANAQALGLDEATVAELSFRYPETRPQPSYKGGEGGWSIRKLD